MSEQPSRPDVSRATVVAGSGRTNALIAAGWGSVASGVIAVVAPLQGEGSMGAWIVSGLFVACLVGYLLLGLATYHYAGGDDFWFVYLRVLATVFSVGACAVFLTAAAVVWPVCFGVPTILLASVKRLD